MTDSYTARDAATVLGRSERLVRKLAAEGRLDVVSEHPLRVSQASVHRERNSRKPKPAKGKTETVITAEDLDAIVRAAVAAAVAEVVPKMIEAANRGDEILRDALAQARAETAQLRAELDREKAQPAIRLPPIGWPFRR